RAVPSSSPGQSADRAAGHLFRNRFVEHGEEGGRHVEQADFTEVAATRNVRTGRRDEAFIGVLTVSKESGDRLGQLRFRMTELRTEILSGLPLDDHVRQCGMNMIASDVLGCAEDTSYRRVV